MVLPIKRIEGSVPKSDPKSAPKKLSREGRIEMIIALIQNEPQITRERICDTLGVSLTTLRKDLRILKEQYGVRYEGPSKTGKWVIHTINKAKLMAKT